MSDPIAIAALTGIALGCWAGYMFGSGRLKIALDDNILLNKEIDRLGLELLDFQWGASVEAQAGDEARAEARALKAENESLLEAFAKHIYAGWSDVPSYVPWVSGGNSLKQDEARRLARAVMSKESSHD